MDATTDPRLQDLLPVALEAARQMTDDEDLQREVREGRFRADLGYRLHFERAAVRLYEEIRVVDRD